MAAVALCLALVTVLASCGSVTERRKNKITGYLTEDKLDVSYVRIEDTLSFQSDVYGSGSLGGGIYLYATGAYAYTAEYVWSDGAEYEIRKTNMGDRTWSTVGTVPQQEGYAGIVMIDSSSYYRYTVKEIYDDPGHAILQYPNSYEYRWYRFNFEGSCEDTGKVYSSDEKMTGKEIEDMTQSFRNDMIMTRLGLHTQSGMDRLMNASGIMGKLSEMVAENEHDTFAFEAVCGYNHENGSAIVHCYYRISEGQKLVGNDTKYRLELCFLVNSQGEVRYVGEYGDFVKRGTPHVVPAG